MTLKKISTKSTSSHSANTNDIILRETTTTRLLFRPQIVDNSNNPDASVRGFFVYQRKGKNDEWQVINESTLASLKKGDGIKLLLHSEELLAFYQGIASRYQLYTQHAIPQGNQTFVNVTNKLQAVASLSDDELHQLVESGVGIDALLRLLKWASSINPITDVLDQLESFDISTLQHVRAFSGIATLHEAIQTWNTNSSNSNEQFWQNLFAERSYLMEQIFSCPIVLIKDKAYVGGKSIHNTGGNIVDFLYKNTLTRSVILIEIKTPTTPILGPKYRNGIYNASDQLTGAVLQVLDYRKSLTEELNSLRKTDEFDACDPPCKVIIGKTSELDDAVKRKSFELFRRHFLGVEVVTYDEIFQRLTHLLSVLEGNT